MKIRALIALSASLFLFACGGDDDGGNADTGVAYMCVGSYANRTYEEFAAGAADTGNCISESDLGAVCDADLTALTGTCALGCSGNDAGLSEIAACTSQCVKNQPATVVDPSDACLGCYLGSVACVFEHCQSQCVPNSTSQACIDCRAAEGCTATFFMCSGLPIPG